MNSNGSAPQLLSLFLDSCLRSAAKGAAIEGEDGLDSMLDKALGLFRQGKGGVSVGECIWMGFGF